MQYGTITDPVRAARKKSDTVVLVVTILLCCAALIVLSFSQPEVLLIATIGLVASLVFIYFFQIKLLASAMRVQNGKHSQLKMMADEICRTLDVPPVDIYVTQDPYLNAYALGFTRPFSIVLNSAVVERLSRDEAKAILLHEVGHIKYHHTVVTAYTAPLSNLPIIGVVIQWVFGFWSRRAEKTCDRLSAAYSNSAEHIIAALIKIHVGAEIGDYMGPEGVIYQDMKGRSLSRRVAQSFESHPFLVTRVQELLDFSRTKGIAIPQDIVNYLNSQR